MGDMKLVSCQPSGTYIFEMACGFLENLCTLARKYSCDNTDIYSGTALDV